mmetsp:Transcript_23175/g.34716  ORF Transcript_23175/g.34716 Transcript_23175/m.34716 type:complete len:896 (-) Transcript_23175:217-2904(-)
MAAVWRLRATLPLFLCCFIGIKAHVTHVCSATDVERPGELVLLIGTYHRPPRSQFHEKQGEIVVQSSHGTEHRAILQDYCRIRRVPPTTTVTTISEYLRSQDGDIACNKATINGTLVFKESTQVTCYAAHPDPALREHSMTVGLQGGESAYCLHYEYGLTAEHNSALWDKTRSFYYTKFEGMRPGTFRVWIENGSPYIHSGGQPPCSLDVTSKKFNGFEDPSDGPDLGRGQPTILQVSVFDGKSSCPSPASLEFLPHIETISVRKCPDNAPSGFACSVVCASGYIPVGDIVCHDGIWDTASFSCAPSFCAVPDATNDSNGNAVAISSVSGDNCGILTQTGVECDFKCASNELWGSGIQCSPEGTWKLLSGSSPCATAIPPHGTENPTTSPTMRPSTSSPATSSPELGDGNITSTDGDNYEDFSNGKVIEDKDGKERSDIRTGVLVGGTIVFFLTTALSCCMICCLMTICFVPPMHATDDDDKLDVEEERQMLNEEQISKGTFDEKQTSDALKNPEKYMTRMPIPEWYSWADLYAILLTILLIPAILVVFIAGVVLNIIPLTIMELHRNFFLPRPLDSINRSTSFSAFVILISIFYLPIFFLAITWSIFVLGITIGASFPWAVCNLARTIDSITSLASFVGAPGSNCDVHPQADRYAREYASLWSPSDLIVGFIGAMDRQGFSDFFISVPLMISVVPVIKLLFMANPFLYDLSEIAYVNQWSLPLDANNDAKVNDEDVALVLSNIKTHVSRCRLSAMNRSIVDAMPFAGHYPYPPSDRTSKTSAGVQYSTASPSALITHTTHAHDIPGYVAKSRNARFGIYSVYLMAWNPWHHLVGYVEVNLRHDGRAEHPMWLLADKSSRFHSQRCQEINDLFVRVGDGFRMYLQAQKSYQKPPA